MANKHLYIIAGPNGAGKTTTSKRVLPQLLHCKHWVNADEIAAGLSPFDPSSVAFEAGRIMLKRIQQLLSMEETFAIETTLATRSYHKLVEQAHSIGYKVELLFFYLPSPEIAKKRVAHRVRNGGHNIPDEVIERRYHLGLKNLKELFMPIVDKWTIINTYPNFFTIARGSYNNTIDIQSFNIFNDIMEAKEPEVIYGDDFDKMLVKCCREATLDMIKEMAIHNELVVTAGHDGKPIWVKASEILEKNPELTLRNVEYTPVDIKI